MGEKMADVSRDGNVIPKRMAFFWVGPMSWARYITVQSFRLHNPEWEIELYRPDDAIGPKRWDTPEDCDWQYSGADYSHKLADIGVEVKQYTTAVSGLAPAQASDVFQWDYLSSRGGWYADMDIVFFRPMDAIYESTKNASAVICLQHGLPAIGLLGGKQGGAFRHLYLAAVRRCDVTEYQSFGVKLLNDVYPTHGIGGTSNGNRLARRMRADYPTESIGEINESVYPFRWDRIVDIYTPESTWVPSNSLVGLHWYGGADISREWANSASPERVKQETSAISDAIKMSGVL